MPFVIISRRKWGMQAYCIICMVHIYVTYIIDMLMYLSADLRWNKTTEAVNKYYIQNLFYLKKNNLWEWSRRILSNMLKLCIYYHWMIILTFPPFSFYTASPVSTARAQAGFCCCSNCCHNVNCPVYHSTCVLAL